MAAIKEVFFHIKGTKDYTTANQYSRNYVRASLRYEKGEGYIWTIHRVGRYTWHDKEYGDTVMACFTIGDKAPSLSECILPCTRAGKVRERMAIDMFDGNVVNTIRMLGYEIDEVES